MEKETMISSSDAQKIYDGIQMVSSKGLKFGEFKNYIGNVNFPFDKYSDFRVKNMTGKLTVDYIINTM